MLSTSICESGPIRLVSPPPVPTEDGSKDPAARLEPDLVPDALRPWICLSMNSDVFIVGGDRRMMAVGPWWRNVALEEGAEICQYRSMCDGITAAAQSHPIEGCWQRTMPQQI
jgi:hypothetical protein